MDTSNQNQPQIHQTIVVVGKQKSVGTAFALAFFFGPLGLLYASVTGGVVMFFVTIIIGFITFGFGIIFTWIGCIIWAVVAAGNANKNMTTGAGLNINNNFSGQQPQQPNQLTQTISEQQHVIKTNDPSPVVEIQNQLSEEPQKVLKASNIQVSPTQPSFDLAKWFDKNKKSVFVGAGSFVGLLILIVAVKYVLSIDFGKTKINPETIQVKQPIPQQNNIPTTPGVSSGAYLQPTQVKQSTPQQNISPTTQSIISGSYPQASERFLSNGDVVNLNKYQLKIMRNEIFARHGYIFKTPEMKSYFSQQTWYHGQYDNVNSMLSNIEKRNVELIKKYE